MIVQLFLLATLASSYNLPRWSNPSGSVLRQLRPNVYVAEREFYPSVPLLKKTDVGGKMAVLKLSSTGGLLVHSSVELTPALKSVLLRTS